jgi:integrase
MPRIKLDQKTVDKLKAPHPSGKQVMFWDRTTPGFGVRVSGSTTQKAYVAQRDLPNGRSRRVTIGTTGELTFEEAKDKARDVIHEMRHGVDPKAARLGGAVTLEATLKLYIDRHPLSEKSKTDYHNTIHRHLADWLKFSLPTITGDMVEKRYHELVEKKGKATANLCFRIFRAVYNYVARRDAKLPSNPTRVLARQWKKLRRRTRRVGADRMVAFYAAVMKLENKIQRDYILLVLFTGLRRTAAASLTWDQIDFTEGVIRVPWQRTKHKRDEFKLPMSDYVAKLLGEMTTRSEGGLVFPANSESGHIEEPKHPLGLIAEATGISVSVHDLRRDFTTAAENTDMSAFALKALVDHTLPVDDTGNVTAGYVDLTVARLREPAQRVCDLLKAWCGV